MILTKRIIFSPFLVRKRKDRMKRGKIV